MQVYEKSNYVEFRLTASSKLSSNARSIKPNFHYYDLLQTCCKTCCGLVVETASSRQVELSGVWTLAACAID